MSLASIKECEVGIGVHQDFYNLTLGPFDKSDYLLPASENSGYIAITASFAVHIIRVRLDIMQLR